jgi:cytochrome c6
LRPMLANRTRMELIPKMKRVDVRVVVLVTALAAAVTLPLTARAQNASETLYKAKCAACHAADGSGSPIGKKMGVHDFTAADVQKMSDADLSGTIATGKNKMPKYGSLRPEDIKGLVVYIRTLKK